MAAPVDRTAPPPPGPIQPFRFPEFRRARLAGGLTVVAAPRSSSPLALVELVVPAGGQHTPPGGAGLASLTAALLDEGTVEKSAMDIAARIEQLGGSLATGVDWNAAYVLVNVLARHLPEALELLAEVAARPTFPPEEVERLRRQYLAELLQRRHQPDSLANEVLARVVYRGTVYADPLSGTEASLGALTRPEILAFYRRHYRLGDAALIAVGDLDPDDLTARLAELFDPPQDGPAPPPPAIAPPPLPGLSLHLVARPRAAQTELRVGHAGVPRDHPDRFALALLNSILGGKFTSRINLNLRERHGYTYGAESRFVPRQGPGPFQVAAAVATEAVAAALAEILAELRRIRQEPVTDGELRDAKSYLAGTFPYRLQTLGDVVQRLEDLVVYDLPDDEYAHYLERIEGVTRDEVLAAARQHLYPDRLAVVAVGPAEEIEPQLGQLGEVTVWDPAQLG